MMLRVGIIGFGRMGITHFSILGNHPDVQIVSVCDTHSFMRKNAEQYFHVKAYSDYVKMLDEMELDCVLIATPTATHQRDRGVCSTAPVACVCRKTIYLESGPRPRTGFLGAGRESGKSGWVRGAIQRRLHEGEDAP